MRGLKTFCVDVDTGNDKAADGLGYLTKKDGVAALLDFVTDYNLPEPSHIIDSGGGIHAYWSLDRVVTSEEWTSVSLKLQALAAQTWISCRSKPNSRQGKRAAPTFHSEPQTGCAARCENQVQRARHSIFEIRRCDKRRARNALRAERKSSIPGVPPPCLESSATWNRIRNRHHRKPRWKSSA